MTGEIVQYWVECDLCEGECECFWCQGEPVYEDEEEPCECCGGNNECPDCDGAGVYKVGNDFLQVLNDWVEHGVAFLEV